MKTLACRELRNTTQIVCVSVDYTILCSVDFILNDDLEREHPFLCGVCRRHMDTDTKTLFDFIDKSLKQCYLVFHTDFSCILTDLIKHFLLIFYMSNRRHLPDNKTSVSLLAVTLQIPILKSNTALGYFYFRLILNLEKLTTTLSDSCICLYSTAASHARG